MLLILPVIVMNKKPYHLPCLVVGAFVSGFLLGMDNQLCHQEGRDGWGPTNNKLPNSVHSLVL